MVADIIRPISLSFSLLRRFWPQLVALVLAGVLAGDLLMQVAAKVALANHFAGLAMLTLVALAQLVVTVAMFHVLRPGLPNVLAAQRGADKAAESKVAGNEASDADRRGSRLVRMITIALLPFFAYYAAWGFLGDIVRQYSRASLDQAGFGQSGNVLDVLDSRWLLISVAVSWLIRRLAKFMQTKTTATSFWQIVVVICETNWIFVGLYVISRWKDSALQWLMSRNFWSVLQASIDGLASPVPVATAAPVVTAASAAPVVTAASAAPVVPVEITSITASMVAVSLFFYMLLPLIWLVMAALIYGYEVRDEAALMRVNSRVERFGQRYAGLPKFLRDFIEHFIAGYRSRYLPIANGVRLTVSSSLVLLCTLIVGYRLLDWGAAWLWLGATRLIGPHELDVWQIFSHGVTLLFGSPFQDSSTGILIEPIRICFLAAVLETAFSLSKGAGNGVSEAAA
ncbi:MULTISPECIES: hypothetical protein [unclassified Mesorhizobium]|uniref:hypothetical protein n=1 Tax=unclassified Mesorhizobium TaxID=325217 RepID=UPI00109361AC|nr:MULTISPECIES: hypothetical protein [unclassified Mesorhizobium]TGT87104.1 hypothetical protein EN804_18550 [Mesorhizobium sp. M8A.F.Ca.ET.161.01.1.1]TGV40969.1 hypothetical protein EN785_18535 [Mesorhizobium sp. M8A.F.Ca.ET.142.01.1.1]